ncbi:MAG: 6-phosphogluconolactonase [Hyphomicrobiales bacterium]
MINSISKYDNRSLQAEKLGDSVAAQLDTAIKTQGYASLAIPGGTTPAPFMQHLSTCDIDWSKVTVTTTDERVVDESSERSNAKLVAENLLINRAKTAQFASLHLGLDGQGASLANLNSRVEKLLPLDVCVLGMGADMHIASLFPKARGLDKAISIDCEAWVLPVTPASGDEDRITLTASVLASSAHLHLLIVGEEKLNALTLAKTISDEKEAPVRVILGHADLEIHYAES